MLNIDNAKLARYLQREFDFAFNREWDDLPDNVREHWTMVADEVALELVAEGIITEGEG
jgi:hypothetical protein